jgi:pimeloyl-ACP methyl ester carboxylesterase
MWTQSVPPPRWVAGERAVAERAEFLDFDVDGVGGAALGALRWPGLLGTPTIVALHGLTSNAWAWDPLAHHLAGGAQIIALDLRGRGRSYESRGPFGIRQHADDVAAVIAQLDGPAFVVGHSMGAFVALMAAKRHPDAVRDIVLVDGGPPVSLPTGPDVDIDVVLDATLGPEIDRLRTVWPDRVSYQAMWASHPAFVGGISPDLERNLLAELIEVDGGFRTAVNEAAVRVDGRELLADNEVRRLLDEHLEPTTIVRAEFGVFGGLPPSIGDKERNWYPQHRWIDAVGLNHYTILNSSAGAALVAQAVRDCLSAI